MREESQRGVEAGVTLQGPLRERDRAVDENGVDLTLVRYTLGLTPTERLLALEQFVNALATARPKSPLGWG